MKEEALTERVIGAAIEVDRILGPGLLEGAYEESLAEELRLLGIGFQRQVALEATYKGVRLQSHYRADLVVEGLLVVEVKAVERLLPVHHAQLLTYMKQSEKSVGLLLNFNVPALREGIGRMVL